MFQNLFLFGVKDKFFCNGVNKKRSDIKKEKFLDVLLTKKNSPGVNRGLCVVNNTMYTFIPKRKGLGDGVSTLPLDI